jgi:hypothetical protein
MEPKPFSDEELEKIRAWGYWYNNTEIMKLGNDVAFQRFLATIDALKKRVGELENEKIDICLEAHNRGYDDGKEDSQSRITQLEGALEKAMNHIEKCGGCLSQTETSELRGILDTALAEKGGEDESERK